MKIPQAVGGLCPQTLESSPPLSVKTTWESFLSLCRMSYISQDSPHPSHTSFIKLVKLFVDLNQFSRSVMPDFLGPHESQHASPPCLSPTPGVHPNPCPLSTCCHPTISSSVIPFSCPQAFPASGSFQMSQIFASGGQSIGVSALASVLSKNTQD